MYENFVWLRDFNMSTENSKLINFMCSFDLHSIIHTPSCHFLEILNKIVQVKVKVLRFNNNAFMTKSLRKVIMLRSRLKNNFNKKRSDENWDNYKKQGIFVLNYSARPKKNILMILMSKVFLTTKNSGKP